MKPPKKTQQEINQIVAELTPAMPLGDQTPFEYAMATAERICSVVPNGRAFVPGVLSILNVPFENAANLLTPFKAQDIARDLADEVSTVFRNGVFSDTKLSNGLFSLLHYNLVMLVRNALHG